MNLALPTSGLEKYKSASQRARISSESWAARELYCPRCSSNTLNLLPGNTPVFDLRCPDCASGYQLKSGTAAFKTKLTDGAYSKMRAAVLEGRAPNLLLLRYNLISLSVLSLVFIPDFAFTLSALECRPPLSADARRAGWVGCNILLSRIPSDARILLVTECRSAAPAEVRRVFRKLNPLTRLSAEKRGWILDVLNVIRSLKKNEFDLSEVYAFELQLSALHPNNRHVRDKIRQQLQVLRDLNLLKFHGSGRYELT